MTTTCLIGVVEEPVLCCAYAGYTGNNVMAAAAMIAIALLKL